MILISLEYSISGYLKEHEHEIDQTEKKGDTPEKIHYQKSPKVCNILLFIILIHC